MSDVAAVTVEGLLALGLERERIPDYWLEQLVPEPVCDGEALVGMRAVDGSRPGWMRDGPDVRGVLRADVPRILARIATAQAGQTWALLDLIPRATQTPIDPEQWVYIGATRVGDTLELWFAAEGWYHYPQGYLRHEHDIVTIRAPITSSVLRAAVVDREEWLHTRAESSAAPPSRLRRDHDV